MEKDPSFDSNLEPRYLPDEQQELYYRNCFNGVLEACGLNPEHYEPTVKPFNIDYYHGYQPHGFDITDLSNNQRMFLTTASDDQAEHSVRSLIGDQSVLRRVNSLGPNNEFQTYAIPEGTVFFSELFASSDVSDRYAESLSNKMHAFLAKIYIAVDRHQMRQISMCDIAVIEKGDVEGGVSAKEAVLAIIPPLLKQSSFLPWPVLINRYSK